MIQRLAVSGQLRAGKNWIAEQCGYPTIGFADPIYRIAEYLSGTSNKADPGVRDLMQKIGQWGWGKLDQSYPVSVDRALLTKLIREFPTYNVVDSPVHQQLAKTHPVGEEFAWVNWKEYGTRKDFWVAIMLNRAAKMTKVAVVNTRFQHELEPLAAHGFEHYHVLCSESTRLSRLAGETADAKTQNDTSEHFALWCNVNLPDHHIIWNDEHQPIPPGKQYWTLNQFKEFCNS